MPGEIIYVEGCAFFFRGQEDNLTLNCSSSLERRGRYVDAFQVFIIMEGCKKNSPYLLKTDYITRAQTRVNSFCFGVS